MVEEYFGEGAIEKSRDVFDRSGVECVFLVHGENSFSLSGAEQKLWDIMNGMGLEVKEFTVFSSNPKLEEVNKGIELFEENIYDLVMGVGGGSSIDVAKLINIFSAQKGGPKEYISGEKELKETDLPMLTVPTTAGTGSEATHFAVVYMDGKKYSVSHDSLLPEYVILDPELTLTLPEYQTACTGMDALCQGIESYWSVNSTSESKEYAKEAIELILENIVKVVQDPDNLEARGRMMRGANHSGKAINISKTTAAHACSYVVTSKCGIPHGHAVALMMKEFLKYNGIKFDKVVDDRGEEYLKKTINELYSILGCSNPQEASEFFEKKMCEVGLENRLNKICEGITLNELLEGVNLKRLKNNPVKINRNDLEGIFQYVLSPVEF